jgi:hypothetical protein
MSPLLVMPPSAIKRTPLRAAPRGGGFGSGGTLLFDVRKGLFDGLAALVIGDETD